MSLPDNHLQKIRLCLSPPMCYRSNVDSSFQTSQRAKPAKTPHMIAQEELNYKLGSFLQIYCPGSSRYARPAKTVRANPPEDNWMEAGTRRHPGDYLRTR